MCQNRQAPQVRLRMLFLEGGRRWMMEWRTVSDIVMAGFKTLTVPKTNKSLCVSLRWGEREDVTANLDVELTWCCLWISWQTEGSEKQSEKRVERANEEQFLEKGSSGRNSAKKVEGRRMSAQHENESQKEKQKTKKKSGRLGGGVGWGPDLLTTPIGRKGRKGSQKGNCLEQTFEDDGRTCWCRGAYSRRSRDGSRGESRSPRVHFLLKGIFGGLNLASFLPSLPTCLHVSLNVLYEHIPTDKNTGLVFYI